MLLGPRAGSGAESPGEKIVKGQCAGCHRLEGQAIGRRFKKAPDLIGAGDKYQRAWLLAWLKNPKFKFYPMGYDFQEDRKQRHLALSSLDAEAVSEYLGTMKEPLVKHGVMANVTLANIERGKARYEVLQCFACHRTPDNSAQGWTGGDTSTDLRESGKRYQADWLHRFNQNPLDFVPDSAAFVPTPTQNVTEQDVFDVTAYIMTLK
ncbi:MAG: cytochrome c [Nitrospirales bacterium]|nr:cytochrome c [Nitrospirales bacterium]